MKPEPPYGDIHPRDKIPVANRLADAILGMVYKTHKNSITGPGVESCNVTSDGVSIYILRETIPNDQLISKTSTGFEIRDNTNVFFSVLLEVDCCRIEVHRVKSHSNF